MYSFEKAEFVIQEVAGCGHFQVVFVICQLLVTRISTVFSMVFLMFGNYNPGWRCLDSNATTNESIFHTNDPSQLTSMISNVTDNSFSENFDRGNCQVFESCKSVEFSPHTSTILSEWGLLCSKGWIMSTIISVQMAGVAVGSVLCGYVADAIGRKSSIYGALAGLIIFNVVSVFSISWEMFMVLRFLLGFVMAFNLTLHNVYCAEFVTKKWRSPVCALPEWPACAIVFSVICLYLKDWRQIHIITAVLGVIGFIPVLWVPESLRWLEVKNKMGKFKRAAQKVVKMNGKTLPSLENLHDVVNPSLDNEISAKTYNMFHLFKKDYWKYTLILTLPWFSVSLISFTISFGVKALYGNFYLNLIFINGIELPFSLLPMLLPNLVGRRLAGIIFCLGTFVCLVAAACFDMLAFGTLKYTAVMVFVSASSTFVICFWYVLAMETIEIYPTVVRGLANSWVYTTARIGGVVAPFLIPNETNTFFVSYIIMGGLILICFGLMMMLPETRAKRLQETFE